MQKCKVGAFALVEPQLAG